MVSSAVIGVGIGVVGKGVASLGLILQKVSHVKNVTGVHFCRDPRWLVGFMTYFCGNVIVIVALTLASQVIIAALDSLVMVYNALLAPYFLENEKFTKTDFSACLLVIISVACVVYFGPKNDKDYASDELLRMLGAGPFVIFTVCSGVLCIGLCCIIKYLSWKKGSTYVRDEKTVAGNMLAVACGTIPAVLSSYNLQLSKIVGELIYQTFSENDNNEFKNWPVYMFICLLILCNTVQVATLQTALSNYSALLIVPIFQVQLTLLAIINGGVYFSEFDSWKGGATSVICFSIGITGCVVGIIVLATRSIDKIKTVVNSTEDAPLVRETSNLIKNLSFGSSSVNSALLVVNSKDQTQQSTAACDPKTDTQTHTE